MRIDLNCDVGESFGIYRIGADDDELFEIVTSANVACGFHAGDPQIIDRTIAAAVRHGVAVGAHPSHHDLRGFGRRPVQVNSEEVESDVLYQVGAVLAFARAHGVELVHVKPHGALYNQAVEDEELASAIVRGVARVSRDLIFVGLATSRVMREAAEASGLRYAGEAFADRVYNPDGTLQSRRIEGSVITDPERAAAQAVSIASNRTVRAHDGTTVPLEAETLCLHGDNPKALENSRRVREALERAGVEVKGLLAG
ncbi:MAG TPA: 5-oxoprolinase subunit PxpA [Vicinamibacteria bacterium]|nr:5-oxoprolinase subunit PxpA [Vicinamibacteria bacterium]